VLITFNNNHFTMYLSLLFVLTWSCGPSVAQFMLNYPPAIGTDASTEMQAPCGGFDSGMNNLTTPSINLTVGAFPIQLASMSNTSQWSFRATIDETIPYEWTSLMNVVNETGQGSFCVPEARVPADWAGKAGLVQVVQRTMNQTLYQVWFRFVQQIND